MGLCSFIHSVTGIAYGQQHIGSWLHTGRRLTGRLADRHVSGLNGETTPFWHGIASIDGKVHDHLLNLSGIRSDPSGVRIEFRAELDDVLPQQSAQHAV